MAKTENTKQDKIIIDKPFIDKSKLEVPKIRPEYKSMFGTKTTETEKYDTKPKDQSYSANPILNGNTPLMDDRLTTLLELLYHEKWEKYIQMLLDLHATGELAAVNRSGQLVKYNTEEPIINACAVAIVPADYFTGHKSNPDSDQYMTIDSSLVSEIADLPQFFLQGTTLISKAALLTTGTGGNQRSWHQLPNITTTNAIIKLMSVLPYLTNFGGKIIM